MEKVGIKVGRIQIFVVGLVVLWFICLGRQFVQLWVGASFTNTYWCAILLILPSFFHLPQEIASTAIIAANKVKQQAGPPRSTKLYVAKEVLVS